MPKFVVTCPDRRGTHNGFFAAGKHFPDGPTLVDLTAEEQATIAGEIERRESILTLDLFDPTNPAHAALAKASGAPEPEVVVPDEVDEPEPEHKGRSRR